MDCKRRFFSSTSRESQEKEEEDDEDEDEDVEEDVAAEERTILVPTLFLYEVFLRVFLGLSDEARIAVSRAMMSSTNSPDVDPELPSSIVRLAEERPLL